MAHKEKLLHHIPAPFLPLKWIQLINKFEKIILYGIIGGIAVVIDVGLFTLLDQSIAVPIIAANAISIGVATVYSFMMNAYFNFRTKTKLWLRFVTFSAVSGLGFLVSSLMLWILSDIMGFNSVLIKSLTLPVVFVLQFVLNSRFTFKAQQNKEDQVLESVM